MEKKRMIGKTLQPARPARHLSFYVLSGKMVRGFVVSVGTGKDNLWEQDGRVTQPAVSSSLLSASFPTVSETTLTFQPKFPCNTSTNLHNEIGSMDKSNGMLILDENLVHSLPEQHKSAAAKERRTYSRDFLLKLSKVSLAQKRPEFLPDHPVVLQKPMKDGLFHLHGELL